MDITTIVEAVTGLVVTILTVIVIPIIKSKYETAKIQKARTWIDIAVQAAEQVLKIDDPDGTKRKAYVMDFLAKKNLTIDFTSLDVMIEAAVLNLNKELNK